MDKEYFINRIITMVELQEDQQRQLKNAVIILLHGVNLIEETAELIVSEYSNENKMKEYYLSKKMENLSDGSISQYLRAVKNFFEFTGKNYKDITSEDIQYYLVIKMTKDGISACYAGHLFKCLNSFFQWLMKKRHIERNPLLELNPVKVPQKEIISLNKYEIVKMRDACRDIRELALVDLLLSTGMRVSEIVTLNINNVDFHSETVNIYGVKSQKWRKGYLTPSAQKHLQEYLATRTDLEGALFVNKKKPHNRIAKGSIEAMLAGIADRGGINKKVTVHVMRKTFASIMFSRGADLKRVADLLGHADTRTTEKFYLQTYDEDTRIVHSKCVA